MNSRKIKDIFVEKAMQLLSVAAISLLILMATGLFIKANPILSLKPISEILFSSLWRPTQGEFGLGGFILGSLWVTGIAALLAVPLSILTAIYLAEYAPKKVRNFIKPIIDLLAGISPVIYGVWGIIAVVPLVRDYLMPLGQNIPFFPFHSDNYTGFSALSAGIVLSVMVFPIIISVVEEVMRSVPFEMREASIALGATKWETIKYAVLRKVRPGIFAAVILGLSRAFGETMAVLMVAGCALQVLPKSIFDSAYPLPALIANTYGETMSIPLYESAVLLAAFILLAVTALFNMIGWGILFYFERNEA